MAHSTYTPIKTKDYLSLLNQFPNNVPITVIHMLRFHTIALCPPSSPHAPLSPMTGRDVFYQLYVPAGSLVAQEVGIAPAETQFFSASDMNLLPHNDIPRDVVTMRRYESFADYVRYQASEAYPLNWQSHILASWQVPY